MNNSPSSHSHQSRAQKLFSLAFEASLVILILIGIFLRVNWVNWSQGTNLHPDEYGLTNTLTQLAIPKSAEEYFNTRVSSISPYQKYDANGSPTTPGPDNRMRWGQFPIIILRWAGEMSGNTGYDEIRLMGRRLSAWADILTLLFIFLTGLRLYGRRIALLATALSALAVMQIQQSHFMTVDNFGSLFTTLTMFAGSMIAFSPPASRRDDGTYGIRPLSWFWYTLFGAGFGMALASKINLLPVGGLLLVAVFISVADLKLRKRDDLLRIFGAAGLGILLAVVMTGLAFRVAQPMSFRASSGDTGFFSLALNPDWVESMQVASQESSGNGGGPPGDQWAHRPIIIFPLVNMVLWGMGLPLGLAAWAGFGSAAWQTLRSGQSWRAHLLPLVWTGGYFLFMGTRWVKSVRYFLPIYPFLCLLAAWGLVSLWNWAQTSGNEKTRPVRMLMASATLSLVILGTLGWANAFTQAVYETPHTRIQATRWVFQNIPAPFHLTVKSVSGSLSQVPLGAADGLQISAARPYLLPFTLAFSGQVLEVSLPKVQASEPGNLRVAITSDVDGRNVLGESRLALTTTRAAAVGSFGPLMLTAGQPYYLIVSTPGPETVAIFRNVIAVESWDEALPVPFDGQDPFGQLYRGLTMEVRWPDDTRKREMFMSTLAESDYLILPSQRSIWATCRIPLTYPMTMEYYRALFDGRLGFEQVALFSAPFKLGPLWISDVGGTLAWNQPPNLPLFNHNLLAVEEAFSVYDHPPVWIFKKRADFSLQQVDAILNSVDLSKVVVQSAFTAQGEWCPAQ